MPVTLWEEVIGEQCEQCQGPATHDWLGIWICCDCHVGYKDGGLISYHDNQATFQFYCEHGRLPVDANEIIDWIPSHG